MRREGIGLGLDDTAETGGDGRDGISHHTPQESWFGAMINSREMINSTRKRVGKGGPVRRGGAGLGQQRFKIDAVIQNCRKIIRDCSLATTSCLVTASFLLLNIT